MDCTEQESCQKLVLHVGCGRYYPEALHPLFQSQDWREIRLDLNPDVEPDIVASITNLEPVADGSIDAIWSSHNIEHLYAHEVPIALGEFYRVLKPSGFLLATMPDIQQVAAYVAQGNLEDTLYMSPSGPIAAIDILFGHRRFIQEGNQFMAHRTGFTGKTLLNKLSAAGFATIRVWQTDLALWTVAYKQETQNPLDLPSFMASLAA
ncbi:MAG: methyltransferase domain-containing protein [Cyanobacteria bacterium]|nr:methyltransferase domain-containing protein [Cyanobacteriota bacterium]MDW8199919.1 methyltransferase domain-containing protein [Cyanobacteriota bacterium SKYGB_h_bin112]